MADEVTPLEILRSRISRIVNSSLDEVEKTLKSGTPSAKAAVMKTTLPALIKILGEEEKADELAEMRRLMGEMAERDRMGIMGMEGQKEMDQRDGGDPSTDGSQGEGDGNVVPFRPTPLDLPTDMSGPT